MKALADNVEEKTQNDRVLKQLNKNMYNDLILTQDDTVCFQIVEDSVKEDFPNGRALCA